MKAAKAGLVLCGLLFCLSGCVALDVVEFVNPEGPPDPNSTLDGYHSLVMNQSTSGQALTAIYLPEYELLSQSKNVIVSVGQKKHKGFKTWFKMVAFDELSQAAERKYLFIVDERPKYLFTSPWEMAILDCQVVIPAQVQARPYGNINAKRIAVLESILENFRKDFSEVKRDNKELTTRGMMVNQSLETVLVLLRESPAMAEYLDDEEGLMFQHINMDRGRIKMVIEDEIVSVYMMLGSVTKTRVDLEKFINSFSLD